MELKDNISTLKGVGPKKSEIFYNYNIETIEDLIYYFPRKYQDRRKVTKIGQLEAGKEALICGRVISQKGGRNNRSRKSPLSLLIDDGTKTIEIVFFNGAFLSKLFKINSQFSFFGRISENYGRFQMVHPEFHLLGGKDDIRGIVPIYPQLLGISQGELRKLIKQAMEALPQLEEWLPEEVIKENRLAEAKYAIENIHFPDDGRKILESKFRLIFEELLILETGLLYINNHQNSGQGIFVNTKGIDEFERSLQFTLTEGQREAWSHIASDLSSNKIMNRLIQGDVGSGKTVLAEMAMYATSKEGYQSVMMAPTELLAKQHFMSISKDMSKFNINVGLLCSSMKAAEKRETINSLKEGKIDILIGTHAVIQSNIEFYNLGLVVTDEQHRFGVKQRSMLSRKGENTNIMVMTATPIPRTLAVILYGDLDISQIHTMPQGRKKIITKAVAEEGRNKVYDFVDKELDSGRQAYVVAPLIEESENIEARSAEEIYKELKSLFKNRKIELLHGAINQDSKDSIMSDFNLGKIDILVSTVVIEVGINVPNATIMVIENCERFGLAQMHQLRGRVGRGSEQSYCFLISGNESKISKDRCEILCQSNDGFKIAEEDLKLRGPGEIFGTRQHGLPELHISDLVRHTDVLEKAMVTGKTIINKDPNLVNNTHITLKKRIKRMFGDEIKLEI